MRIFNILLFVLKLIIYTLYWIELDKKYKFRAIHFLTKNFKLNSVKKTQLCNSCFKEFCNCLRLNDKKIFVYEFDLVNHLTSIIRKNWEISCRYRGIFVLIIISNYKYT